MDYLSGGVCVQNWLHLIEMEFARHVYRTLRGGAYQRSNVSYLD